MIDAPLSCDQSQELPDQNRLPLRLACPSTRGASAHLEAVAADDALAGVCDRRAGAVGVTVVVLLSGRGRLLSPCAIPESA